MLKARIVPLFFPGRDADFDVQSHRLRDMLADVADLLEPVAVGTPLPDAEAVIFPQMLGDAYRLLDELRAIDLPRLVITSEFGTVSMWDWELTNYLRTTGIDTIAPYSLDQTLKVVKALGVKRELKQAKFLAFQDNPGEGMQSEIFKRFYWWEDEAKKRMMEKFGVTLVYRSFKALAEEAKSIPDSAAEAVWQDWQFRLNVGGISKRSLYSALKIYSAVKRHLEEDDQIRGVGINCLNESRFSDTTPCLAWNMLYEESRLIWGCEADTISMMTKYILHKSLDVPIMMTNLYPFLMGQAALKHERIPYFPEVPDNPDNYLLAAHCGYFGVVPQSFSTEWKLVPKVLAIVDPNAAVLDARLPTGDITLAKLQPTFDRMAVYEADLVDYVQYADSDCLNGALVRVTDGHKLVNNIASHHYMIMTGHNFVDTQMIGKVFGFAAETL